ncbi:NEAT domain-containing protein, partial [Geomicrobium sp. JCM 19039]|uniref:NEAT domain-containing protein n=1 Tax=Geomicrobium sp. JCM 19039 TaxID=1460636 RepID=UPI0005A633E2
MKTGHRFIHSFFAFFLVFSLFFPALNQVASAQEAIPDGSYEVDFSVLKDGTDEVSVMDDYTKKPAVLHVNQGSYTIDLTIKNANWYEDFTVQGDRPQVISENPEANERTVQFQTDDPSSKTDAWVHIIVTGIPSFNYDNMYDVQIDFDVDSIDISEPGTEEPGTEDPGIEDPGTEDPGTEDPGIEDPGTEDPGTEDPGTEDPGTEDPGTEDPGTEEPGTEDPDIDEPITLEDGSYTIPFEAKHAEEDRDSAMSRYLVNPASLDVEDGEQTITLTTTDSHQITSLKIEQDGTYTEGEVIAEDEEENTRSYAFTVDNLDEEIAAQVSMRVQVPPDVYENTQYFRLIFDTDGIEQVEEDTDEPGTDEPITLEDGSYTIPFEAKHAEEDRDSAMSRYLVNPASLDVEDGEQTITLTTTDSHQITSLKIEQDGTYTEGEVIDEDEEENTRSYAFTVDNLDEEIAAQVSMRVQVPPDVYENTQYFRLIFDTDGIEQVEEDIDEPGTDELDNGLYSIDFTVLKDGTDETSV